MLSKREIRRAPRGDANSKKARFILGAAEETLARFGATEFSLRKVADGAGMRIATLQYYFPSLDDLIKATARSVLSGFNESIAIAIRQPGSNSIDRLGGAIDRALSQVYDPEARRLFFELIALAARNEEARKIMAEVYDEYTALIAEPLAELHPEMSQVAIFARARLIGSMVDGLMLFQMAQNLPADEWIAVGGLARANVMRIAAAAAE